MGLNESCEVQYIGRRLFVQTGYGWGWVHEPPGIFPTTHGVPPSFYVRVGHFYRYQGVLRGFLARLEEPGHVYEGFWMVCFTRVAGTYDFTANPTHYNIEICPNEPVEGDPAETPSWSLRWPTWHRSGSPNAAGFAMIAETPQHIEEWLSRKTRVR